MRGRSVFRGTALKKHLNAVVERSVSEQQTYVRLRYLCSRVAPFIRCDDGGGGVGVGCDRLQTGMRHAYGKPQGTTARVSIGQVRLHALFFSWS